jgi:hypothetical protein
VVSLLHDHKCDGGLVASVDLHASRTYFVDFVAAHEQKLTIRHPVAEKHEPFRVVSVHSMKLTEKTVHHLVQVMNNFKGLTFRMLLSVQASS